jgi:hypothetical protein
MTYNPELLVVVELRPDSHTTWPLQWMMKMQAMDEVNRVATLLTSEQRSTVDVPLILAEFRGKLVVALLLDGQKQEAGRVATKIQDNRRGRQARHLIAMARLVPNRVIGWTLRLLWQWRQDRSFVWQGMPAALLHEFTEVHMGAR